MIRVSEFYDWNPEVVMAACGNVKMTCVIGFKYNRNKFRVYYTEDGKRKARLYQVLQDAVEFYNEVINR